MAVRILNTNINSLNTGTHFDSQCTGLVLRVGKNKRSWQMRARVNGTLHQEPLGVWPAVSIADAREAVREKIRRLERGLPVAPPALTVARTNGELTLGGLIDRYERYRKTKGERIANIDEALRHLRRSLAPWLDMPAAEVTKADIREARDIIAERGCLGASDQLLKYAGPLFRFAAREDLVPYNFMTDVVRLGAPQSRDRFLNDDEIGLFWQATGRGANTRSAAAFDRMLRFLLVTGQRRGEAANLDWSDVDGDVWRQSTNKSGRPFNVPLTPLALATMNGRTESGLVFAGESGRMSGWSKLKRNLDRRCEIAEPWRIHDLRRTAASGMQRLEPSIDREVIAAVLNHSIPGVTSRYMKDRLEPQKREALSAWSDHVAGLVRAAT